MPVFIASIISSIGGVLLKMLLGVIANPQFIENAFLFLADKLVKQTATDVDDKLLELAKQALAHKEAKAAEPAKADEPK